MKSQNIMLILFAKHGNFQLLMSKKTKGKLSFSNLGEQKEYKFMNFLSLWEGHDLLSF